MREDFRSRVTQKMIVDCFIEILETAPLRKITVTDICKRIGINRATFYRHYDNPYDLLACIESEITDEMKALSDGATTHYDEDYMITLLKFYQRKGKVLKVINSENGDRFFSSRLLDDAYNYITAQGLGKWPRLTDEQNKWLFYYTGRGCMGVVDAWIEEGMKTSVEEVARFVLDCTESINTCVAGKKIPSGTTSV